MKVNFYFKVENYFRYNFRQPQDLLPYLGKTKPENALISFRLSLDRLGMKVRMAIGTQNFKV